MASRRRASGARSAPVAPTIAAMHGPQTQWPTTLENDKKKEKFRERHTSLFIVIFGLNYGLCEASDIIKWLIKTYKWLMN